MPQAWIIPDEAVPMIVSGIERVLHVSTLTAARPYIATDREVARSLYIVYSPIDVAIVRYGLGV